MFILFFFFFASHIFANINFIHMLNENKFKVFNNIDLNLTLRIEQPMTLITKSSLKEK